jgi:hypothetical protein
MVFDHPDFYLSPTVIGSNHPFGGISILLLRIKTIKQSRPEGYCES